jgi:PAS domain S-box-containing protein
VIEQARDARTTYAHEFRSVHPNGRIVWCSGRGRFFYDLEGKPVRMIGVMQDVTKTRLAAGRQDECLAQYRAHGQGGETL